MNPKHWFIEIKSILQLREQTIMLFCKIMVGQTVYSLILKTQEKKENYEKLRELRRPELRRPELRRPELRRPELRRPELSNKNIGP